ncbi:predicted protein [Chaetoceros tenuissimus]|uniref:Uncharacterized protein n=1 Tax=Chaetoceros tenuissimus TaxID=426638 RepID=A0AAD3CJH8_9STRA|nr:predicted protein [Chaetoceros tenuissimus]
MTGTTYLFIICIIFQLGLCTAKIGLLRGSKETYRCPFDSTELRRTIERANRGEIQLSQDSCVNKGSTITVSHCNSLDNTSYGWKHCVGYNEWSAADDMKSIIFGNQFDTLLEPQFKECRKIIVDECSHFKPLQTSELNNNISLQ